MALAGTVTSTPIYQVCRLTRHWVHQLCPQLSTSDCREKQVDFCSRITTLRQLDIAQKEIDGVKVELLESQKVLAAAPDYNFLQRQLVQLNTQEEQLCEEVEQIREIFVLRSQAPGLHGLPWHRYALLTRTQVCITQILDCAEGW